MFPKIPTKLHLCILIYHFTQNDERHSEKRPILIPIALKKIKIDGAAALVIFRVDILDEPIKTNNNR